ncbi:DUF3105 domain-containing protein [Candidatus Nomurabacteria bacterium]|nr:DUF3105 domain-containing protein [Candidatus Woesebacteria bacterium]MCB9826704.1 DUF3105 domain-containing protein [Candidatus Nomurabacteria bacterium]
MQNTNIEYPEEWNELSKHERKKKLKALRHERERKAELLKKIRNWSLIGVLLIAGVFGFIQLTKKSPEQIEFERQVEAISLDGKVEEFEIEGRDHISASTPVDYQTNPPTSGGHLAEAKGWGVYDNEIDDKAGVHNLEHGGIWITYKDISADEIKALEEIGKQNSQSTVVSPRSSNDTKVVVASWGKMMRLDYADKALIQKYINTYKNQSPEKLAR